MFKAWPFAPASLLIVWCSLFLAPHVSANDRVSLYVVKVQQWDTYFRSLSQGQFECRSANCLGAIPLLIDGKEEMVQFGVVRKPAEAQIFIRPQSFQPTDPTVSISFDSSGQGHKSFYLSERSPLLEPAGEVMQQPVVRYPARSFGMLQISIDRWSAVR